MLTEIINDNYAELSATDILVLQYIINNLTEVSNMHIDTLAKHCSVSRTSIYRLAKKLNFAGYSEFKNYIRWTHLKDDKKHDPSQIKRIKSDFESTYNHCETNTQIGNVIDTLHQSETIFVFGTGQAQYYCAQEFQRVFSQIGKFTYVIKALDELELVVKSFGPETVLFVISLSGESKHLDSVMTQCKIKKSTVISLTNFNNNTLAQLSDFQLYATTGGLKLDDTTSHSSFAPFYMVIDYLFTSYFYKYFNQ